MLITWSLTCEKYLILLGFTWAKRGSSKEEEMAGGKQLLSEVQPAQRKAMFKTLTEVWEASPQDMESTRSQESSAL